MAEDKTLPHDTAYYNGGITAGKHAEILVIAMKESREYHAYIEAYNKLSHDEIEELRAFKQIEAQTPASGRLSFDDEKRIGSLYAALTLNADIKSFLEKERAVCDMLTRVYDIIGDVHLFMFDD